MSVWVCVCVRCVCPLCLYTYRVALVEFLGRHELNVHVATLGLATRFDQSLQNLHTKEHTCYLYTPVTCMAHPNPTSLWCFSLHISALIKAPSLNIASYHIDNTFNA